MILYYINSTERSADVLADSLQITNQLGQRTDNCSFTVFQNTKPTENQDLKIYLSAQVESIASATIVLKDTYQTNVKRFYAGQSLFVRIGETDIEKVTVQSYDEATRTIVLTSAPSASVVEDDYIGFLVFGGVIATVEDYNVDSFSNLEYKVTGLDYTKIFDKKAVSDSWEDVDSRYIINDFLNTTVNYVNTIDNMSYDNVTDLRAEWIESLDGDNPTFDDADFLEGDSSGVFGWTFSGGTATWSGSPTARSIAQFVGVSSGAPTEGEFMLWGKATDHTKVTSVKVRIGSDSSNYAEITFTFSSNDWEYKKAKLTDATITGTPDWTAVDYCAIVITQTADSYIKLNGLRVMQNGSFTMYNVGSTPTFDDIRAPQLKPSAIINLLSKTWQYTWNIDYEKDIHFRAKEVESAPYEITEASNNFASLQVDVDASQLGNRVRVRGGEKISNNRYAQVFQGDDAIREWITKSKFSDLEITIDDNGTTSPSEVGTSTTNIKITGHGLATGDHVINRTRTNAVRSITYVDANNFTVEAVPSQTNGDTISFFTTSKTVGVEGLNDEASFNYMSNSNEKSIRASTAEPTLTSTDFIRFEYNERVPIQVQYTDSASSTALKALGFGDGVFDLDPITDKNIKDVGTALVMAQSKVNEYSNPVITGTVKTDQEGLSSGQLLHVSDSNRSLDDYYVIQTVTISQRGGEFKDYLIFNVSFGTTLFGWIEFMQKLLAIQNKIEVNADEIVETYVDSAETITTSDVNQVALVGINKTTIDETVETSDVNQVTKQSGAWHYEASTGQAVATRYNLAEYS